MPNKAIANPIQVNVETVARPGDESCILNHLDARKTRMDSSLLSGSACSRVELVGQSPPPTSNKERQFFAPERTPKPPAPWCCKNAVLNLDLLDFGGRLAVGVMQRDFADL